MTREEIEKKAYEAYPKFGDDAKDLAMGQVRERNGYIKCAEEYEALPKIHGWLSKDPGDSCVHLSFSNPEFDGTYWNDPQGCGVMFPLPAEDYPFVTTKKPVEVEMLIKVK